MIVVTVARRPLSEPSVASNVLAHGTGPLNIDATRVASGGEHMVHGLVSRSSAPAGDEREGASLGWWEPGKSFVPTNHAGGRWPANLVLGHAAGCRKVGTKKVVSRSPSVPQPNLKDVTGRATNLDAKSRDGTEEVDAWECADGCPVAELDGDSGFLHARGNRKPTTGGGGMYGHPEIEYEWEGPADDGGASRFFKQFGGP